MVIQFNNITIKVENMANSSAVNLGTNVLIGFDGHSRSVQGTGVINGNESALPANGAGLQVMVETHSYHQCFYKDTVPCGVHVGSPIQVL